MYVICFKARTTLEERNASLNENLIRIREELRSVEGRKTSLEQDLRRSQNDLTDLSKKCSIAEASLEVANRVCRISYLYSKYVLQSYLRGVQYILHIS